MGTNQTPHEKRHCGLVHLRFEYFTIIPNSEGRDDMCMLRIKVDEAWVPLPLGKDGARMVATFGDVQKVSPIARYEPPVKKQTNETPASSADEWKKIAEFEIEFILLMLVPRSDLQHGVLKLELTNASQAVIAHADIKTQDILAERSLSKQWGEDGLPRLRLETPNGGDEQRCEAMISVSIRGLNKPSAEDFALAHQA